MESAPLASNQEVKGTLSLFTVEVSIHVHTCTIPKPYFITHYWPLPIVTIDNLLAIKGVREIILRKANDEKGGIVTIDNLLATKGVRKIILWKANDERGGHKVQQNICMI